MQSSIATTIRYRIGLLVAILIITIIFLVSGFFVWSDLNCRHVDIDLNTGHVRQSRYLLYVLISDRVDETWLSPQVDAPSLSPNWKRVYTFSPGVNHSPHYQFHGAIHQIKTLERLDHYVPFHPSARRKVAEALIALWNKNGSYFEADKYIDRVTDSVESLHAQGVHEVRSADIPDPPI